ncbi:MAG: acyltransferase [Bacteroidetes bacterium]|nr:acyltransferase [Bacteroidota bacterium]
MSARRHFHTFDALRFFAYFKVFIQHLPVFVFPWFCFVKTGGGIGVQFFFVLSGFLITYIICEEKKQTGSVNLKHFFVRRVLRIWPLFYLMIAVAFFTPFLLSMLHMNGNNTGYEPTWWMSMLFLENYKMIITHDQPNVSPLAVMWSLCVEEHFYIIWGLLLYIIRIEALPKLIAFCIVIAAIARIVFVQHGYATIDLLTNIDLFAFGAIPAYLLITQGEKLENKINSVPIWVKWLFVALLIVIVTLASQYAEDDRPFIWLTTLLGLLFCILITLTLPLATKFSIRDNSLLSKLGIYTYGFYLYHTLVIIFLYKIFVVNRWELYDWWWAVVYVIAAFVITLICSVLSYHLFEKQFLKLKKYFR